MRLEFMYSPKDCYAIKIVLQLRNNLFGMIINGMRETEKRNGRTTIKYSFKKRC